MLTFIRRNSGDMGRTQIQGPCVEGKPLLLLVGLLFSKCWIWCYNGALRT